MEYKFEDIKEAEQEHYDSMLNQLEDNGMYHNIARVVADNAIRQFRPNWIHDAEQRKKFMEEQFKLHEAEKLKNMIYLGNDANYYEPVLTIKQPNIHKLKFDKMNNNPGKGVVSYDNVRFAQLANAYSKQEASKFNASF